jgi:hypothetical protein
MSGATQRRKSPARAIKSSQSREKPGLPCTNAKASSLSSGPDCATTVRTPDTLSSLRRSIDDPQ